MKVEIRELTKEEYNNHSELLIILEDDYINKYAIIKLRDKEFRIAWHHHGLEVKTFLVPKYSLILIGAGDTVVGLSTLNLAIKFNLSIMAIGEFRETELGFMMIGEIDIILINGTNCSISRVLGVPDVIEDVKMEGEKLIVRGLCGETYTF